MKRASIAAMATVVLLGTPVMPVVAMAATKTPSVSIYGVKNHQSVSSASVKVHVPHSKAEIVHLWLNGTYQSGDGIYTLHFTRGKNVISAQVVEPGTDLKSRVEHKYVTYVQPKSSMQTALQTVHLPNAALSDSAYWQRANSSLYIMADTFPNLKAISGPALRTIEPGTTLNLVLASNQKNINTATWYVNSADATVTPDAAKWAFSNGQYKAVGAKFTASKPGIYTVQARDNGKYSEPIVILVGTDQLRASRNLAVNQKTLGVQQLPPKLPKVTVQTQNGITYRPYSVRNGWLPVQGTVAGTKSVVVYLTNGKQSWNYRLPVNNGQFSGMVRIPFTGTMDVAFYKHFNATLTQTGTIEYSNAYTITNNFPMSQTDKALLSSAEMDANMLPQAAKEASILMDNAPSKETGIVAISNYVAEKVVYDWKSFESGKAEWKDSSQVWNKPLGVCQNIAELAATMLRSIGIPTKTILGTANGGSHEWIKVYDGSSWIELDPTWTTPSNPTNPVQDILTNDYNNNSPDFQSSHTYTGLGGWM